jgi:hypothetical protein
MSGGRTLQLDVTGNKTSRSPVAPVIALVAGLTGALIAQFVLDTLADSSDLWHQIQHGLLFIGGLTVGWSLTSLYSIAQRRTRP